MTKRKPFKKSAYESFCDITLGSGRRQRRKETRKATENPEERTQERKRYKISKRKRFDNLEQPGERKVYEIAVYERDKFKFKFSFILPFTLSGNFKKDYEQLEIACWNKARRLWKINDAILKQRYDVQNYSLLGVLVIDNKFYRLKKIVLS